MLSSGGRPAMPGWWNGAGGGPGGDGSHRSVTATAMVVGTILPSGGHRTPGEAATAISGGTVSRTTTVTVSGAESTWPSLTTRAMVQTPRGRLTSGRAPVLVPNVP